MAKLTVRTIEAAKPRSKEYKLTVSRGLYLCIYPSGAKKWLVRFVINGKQQQATLPLPYGNSGAGFMSLAEAIAENAQIQSLAKKEIDYRVEKKSLQEAQQKKLKEQAAQGKTLNELISAWLKDGVAHQDGNIELERRLKKDVIPALGDKAVKDINEADIRELLSNVLDRNAYRMTEVVYKDLAQLFKWALKRQPWRGLLTEGNPTDLIDIQQFIGPVYEIDYARERVLLPEEIRELRDIFERSAQSYDNLPTGQKRRAKKPVAPKTQLAVWICLSTACRIAELLKARWEDIDLEQGAWLIPKANSKGKIGKKKSNLVFLSPFALSQFQTLHTLSGHTEWCFPNDHGDGYIYLKTISKQIADRQARFKKVQEGGLKGRCHDDSLVLADGENGQWWIHDMRRTAATFMQELKVPEDIIDRCQNHVIHENKRVRRHYMHYDYATEKKEAWDKLGRYLESILGTE